MCECIYRWTRKTFIIASSIPGAFEQPPLVVLLGAGVFLLLLIVIEDAQGVLAGVKYEVLDLQTVVVALDGRRVEDVNGLSHVLRRHELGLSEERGLDQLNLEGGPGRDGNALAAQLGEDHRADPLLVGELVNVPVL